MVRVARPNSFDRAFWGLFANTVKLGLAVAPKAGGRVSLSYPPRGGFMTRNDMVYAEKSRLSRRFKSSNSDSQTRLKAVLQTIKLQTVKLASARPAAGKGLTAEDAIPSHFVRAVAG
jgi:hypothetical protein